MNSDQESLKTRTTSFDIDFNELNLGKSQFVEHRIKILSIKDITLKPGIEKSISTNLVNCQTNFPKYFHLHLKSSNKLPLKLLSEKVDLIDNRLFVKIQNNNNFSVKIYRKTPIAYLFIQSSI